MGIMANWILTTLSSLELPSHEDLHLIRTSISSSLFAPRLTLFLFGRCHQLLRTPTKSKLINL